MIDSHCHLNCLPGNVDDYIKSALAAGVTHMLCPGIDYDHFDEILAIAEKYPQVKAGLGIHPNDVDKYAMTYEDLYKAASHAEVIAIGETGLDYYRDSSDKVLQQEQFIMHIAVAKALKKPLIIHARDSHADVLNILKQEDAGPAIMHCFTETLEIAHMAIDLGCLISFSGIITFKNAQALQSVVTALPLKYMLIETDAPYLAPEPYRGKTNQPAYVVQVAKKVAQLKGITEAEVSHLSSENYLSFFHEQL